MAAMQQERLRPLTVAEQRELHAIAKASSERVDRVKRATALLAVADGETFAAASRAAGYRSIGAVTYLVRRFNRVGPDALGIAAGRGRRPTYGATARGRIVATAQRPPDRKADGTATWSLSTLERTVRREGLPRVGATTIGGYCTTRQFYQRTRRGAAGTPSGSARRASCRWWIPDGRKGGPRRRTASEGLAPLWCQDEAGRSATPTGGRVGDGREPARCPRIRAWRTQLLTLLRPAPRVRAKGVRTRQCLHPWLQRSWPPSRRPPAGTEPGTAPPLAGGPPARPRTGDPCGRSLSDLDNWPGI